MSRNNSSRRSQSHNSKPAPTDIAQAAQQRSSRSPWKSWLFAASVISAVFVYFWWTTENPQQLYLQARGELNRKPAQAEKLAERAIDRAGGDFPAAQLLQCRALAMTNQWNAALGGFSLIKDTAGCEADELVELAGMALKSDQEMLAQMALAAVLERREPSDRAFGLIIALRTRQRDLQAVTKEALRWKKTHPESAAACSVVADLAAKEFDLGSAISGYREALKLHPDADLETHVRTNLVQLLADTGDYGAARRELDWLLQHGSLNNDVRLKEVQLLRAEGQFRQAFQKIEAYLKDVGYSTEAVKQRGILFFDSGDDASAIRDLKQAVAEDPYDKAAHFKLAQAYLRTNQKDLAAPHLERQRELTAATNEIVRLEANLQADPENLPLREKLEELYVKIGRKRTLRR